MSARREVAVYDPTGSAATAELDALLWDQRDEEPDWQDLALCTEADPDEFFPEKGGSTRAAKKVCRSCEVRAECLEFALANDEKHGVWGGMSERERRRIREQRRGKAAA